MLTIVQSLFKFDFLELLPPPHNIIKKLSNNYYISACCTRPLVTSLLLISIFPEWKSIGRCLLENPWHNASFEGAGFVRLFLPTNLENQGFFQP